MYCFISIDNGEVGMAKTQTFNLDSTFSVSKATRDSEVDDAFSSYL